MTTIAYYGYDKFQHRTTREKYYHPVLIGTTLRRTRRVFKTADSAKTYGKKLSVRFNRTHKES